MDDRVRHLAVGVDHDAQTAQILVLVEQMLLGRVPDVDDVTARRKSRRELLDDLLDENVLPAGSEFEHLAVREVDRYELHASRPLAKPVDPFPRQILGAIAVPGLRLETPQQVER